MSDTIACNITSDPQNMEKELIIQQQLHFYVRSPVWENSCPEKYYKAPAVIRAKREAPKASKGFKIVKKPKEEGKG